jgi:lipoprotein-releasing system permease protein
MPSFPDSWDALSIKQASPQIFDWLNMQDITRNILIAFMAIVAAINLITALLILVLERTRMIGILKSVGANNWIVQSIFLRYSIIITSIGIGIGTLLGLGLLWLQEKTGFIKLNEEAYFLDKAAVKIVWSQIALIDLGTLAICTIVLLIPSLIVRKISPAKAIQFK